MELLQGVRDVDREVAHACVATEGGEHGQDEQRERHGLVSARVSVWQGIASFLGAVYRLGRRGRDSDG